MAKFTNNTFQNATVKLDNNEYENCQFNGCILDYSGIGPVTITGCEFSNVKWIFSGPAQNTISFLNAAYSGLGEGGKMLVDEIFEAIKNQTLKKPLRSGME